MKKSRIFLGFVLLFCGFFVGCGRKGPILPPLLKSPHPVKNVSVKQMGKEFLVRWTSPTSYMDGSSLPETSQIEVWLFLLDKPTYKEEGMPNKREFAKRAKIIQTLNLAEMSSGLEEMESKDSFSFKWMDFGSSSDIFITGLRVNDGRNKTSDFMLKVFAPVIVSLAPSELKASFSKKAIKVEWKEPQENIDSSLPPKFAGYHVYRVDGDREPYKVTEALLKTPEFLDTDFSFGVKYTYLVRAVHSPDNDNYESGDSLPVSILPKDIYPPDPPDGLIAISGSRLVALSWTANTEKDLSGYKIWRREAQGGFVLIASLSVMENSYNDKNIETDKEYTYAVSAVDTEGNESERSGPVSVSVRRDQP